MFQHEVRDAATATQPRPISTRKAKISSHDVAFQINSATRRWASQRMDCNAAEAYPRPISTRPEPRRGVPNKLRDAAMSTFMKDCDAAKASSDVMETGGDSRFINLWVRGAGKQNHEINETVGAEGEDVGPLEPKRPHV